MSLAAIARPYALRGVFTAFANGDIRNSMRTRINGQEVDLKWIVGVRFDASVPQGLLASGRNGPILTSPVDLNFFDLSARIDWVALEPL